MTDSLLPQSRPVLLLASLFLIMSPWGQNFLSPSGLHPIAMRSFLNTPKVLPLILLKEWWNRGDGCHAAELWCMSSGWWERKRMGKCGANTCLSLSVQAILSSKWWCNLSINILSKARAWVNFFNGMNRMKPCLANIWWWKVVTMFVKPISHFRENLFCVSVLYNPHYNLDSVYRHNVWMYLKWYEVIIEDKVTIVYEVMPSFVPGSAERQLNQYVNVSLLILSELH